MKCASKNYNGRRNQNANISYKAANPRFAEGQWDEVVSKLQVEKPTHRDNFMLRAGIYAVLAFCCIIVTSGGASEKIVSVALRAKGRYQPRNRRWARVLWTEGTAWKQYSRYSSQTPALKVGFRWLLTY